MKPSNPHITYSPRPGATPEGELNALASVYSFVLRTRQNRNLKKEGSPSLAALDDTRGESKHVSRADKAIIPE